MSLYIYREDFYFLDRFDGSALHGNRGVACREAQTNFADESACLTADTVRNEVVAIHRSQEVSKMLSLYVYILSKLIILLKKHRYNSLSCT
jgi:hypothetical protein